MATTPDEPALSPCLERVREALNAENVSAARLARTVCEKHSSEGRAPYRDILRALSADDSTDTRPFGEWLSLLLRSCDPLVDVLHTDLTLLLIARHSPAIAAAFGKSDTSSSIDSQLREQMREFIGDVQREHEIVSQEEFRELVANQRKTDGRDNTVGRKKAAIIYSADAALDRVEKWTAGIDVRACVPLRVHLAVGDLDAKLADASVEPLRAFRGGGRRSKQLAEQLAKASRSAAANSLGAAKTVAEWERVLEKDDFVGHRLVLMLELEGVDDGTIPVVTRRMQDAVASRHDRLIVVVGGMPVDARLEHAQGVWAYRLRAANQTEGVGQTIANDLASGQDLLDLRQEVAALADGIASAELTPPLAVGICGGWGAGKSFVLDLIDRRLREIRTQDVPAKDALHVGHIYWIEFDAWTYSKQDLWASLMYQICRQFEEQLNIERIQFDDRDEEEPRIAANLAPWVVSKKLAGTEPSDLKEHTGWALQLASDQQNLGELLRVVDEEGLAKRQEGLRTELKEAQDGEAQLKKEREDAIERDVPRRVTRDFVRTISVKLLEALGVKPETLESLDDLAKLRTTVDEDVGLLQRVGGAARSPYVVPGLLAGLAALALHGIEHYKWTLPTGILTLVGSVGLATSRVLDARQKIHDRISRGFSELDVRREDARAALAKEYDEKEKFGQKLEQSVETQNGIKAKLDELRRKSEAPFLVLEDLQDFLEEIRADGVYTSRLGLMNQVQTHLQKLSRLITGWSARQQPGAVTQTDGAYTPFHRGKPRIILKIDDLDRCPPPKVIQVLEAAQLLVKTDLFVVLLALDLRYVTRAIENCYEGILSHEEHPTGLDYIEKIIQLPYRVRPIPENYLEAFFGGHLEYVTETPPAERREDTPPPAARVGDLPAPRTIHIAETPLRRQVLQLSETEFSRLVDACRALELSPRAGKRIANVYKIWKLLWSKRGDEPPSEDVKQAMVALLALSTVRPRLARHALRRLAHLSQDGKRRRKRLSLVLRDLATELDEPPHIQDLFSSESIFPAGISVGALRPQDRALLTSFSFVGDDDHDTKRARVHPTTGPDAAQSDTGSSIAGDGPPEPAGQTSRATP